MTCSVAGFVIFLNVHFLIMMAVSDLSDSDR